MKFEELPAKLSLSRSIPCPLDLEEACAELISSDFLFFEATEDDLSNCGCEIVVRLFGWEKVGDEEDKRPRSFFNSLSSFNKRL